MSDLLLMSPPGIPRNGLVALYDPYRDFYGRNLLPVGSENFTTGWVAQGGATITVTPNQPDPDGGNNAYRIQSSGGIYVSKYAITVTGNPNPHSVYIGCYMKVLAGSAYMSVSGAGASKVAGTSEWSRLLTNYTISSANDSIYFETAVVGGELDILVYHPTRHMITHFPYSLPAGAPGTLQTSLDYSGNGNHLTLGATTNASTDDPAFTGTAWSFDGGDFLLGPTAQTFQNGFTSMVVFKHKTGSTGKTLLSKWGATNNVDRTFFHGISTDNKIRGFIKWGGTYVFGTTTLTNGVWYLSTFSFDNAILRLSIGEGTALTAESAGAINADASQPIRLGCLTTIAGLLGDFFDSEVAFVGIWDRPLQTAERVRSYRTLKSLMARRGVTLA